MGRTRIAAVLLASALVVAACGDDDAASPVTVPADGTGSAPTSERPTTTTTEDPTAAVEQAFFDQWDAFLEVASNPDPSHPLISAHFVGRAEESVRDGVSKLVADGHSIRRPDDPSRFVPAIREIRRISDSEYLVFECTIQGLVLIDQESGAVLDDAVADYERKSTYVLDDGRWKVQSTERLEAEDPACDDR